MTHHTMTTFKLNPSRRALALASLSSIASLVLFLLAGSDAEAVSTRSFFLDSAAELRGEEMDGVLVHSDGHVTRGVAGERSELEGVPLARCVARSGNDVFIGTGDEGRVLRVRGGQTSVLAETGELLATSCVVNEQTLYVGTVPHGKIFAIDIRSGESRELVQLPETEHVWALVFAGNRLFAGTGPDGKIFSVDPRSGSAEVRYDSEEGHILSLASDGERVYAGTDGAALVYRIDGDDVSVVHDFPGNEITALDARDGQLVVVANDMPAPRRATTSTTKAPSKTTPRAGKGRLYRVDADARVERVLAEDSDHFMSVVLGRDGAAYVGSGHEGRIYRVAQDRTSAIWLDVDERQVLDIELVDDGALVVTGDGAALYRVANARGDDASWISKVLDATHRARFGRIEWSGEGAVQVSTRSGNTEEPDDTWSDWSAPQSSPGPVRSAAARYIQIRAIFPSGSDASLRSVRLYYLPQNQRASVSEVGLKAPSTKRGPDAMPEASTTVPLVWKVSNPDEDELRYLLRFRREDQTRWRDMLDDDTRLTETHYDWQTLAIPDGRYVVEVTATDAISNPADRALSDRAISEVITVDNHAPELNVSLRGRRLVGSARDSLGPIRRLEWALDGEDFWPLHPEDGLFDEAQESFSFELPEDLTGDHLFAVRAYDSGGNAVVAETSGTLPSR